MIRHMPSAPANIDWATSASAVSYPDALQAMQRRAAAIRDEGEPELVWLLEHPPLYTAGASARREDLRLPHRLPVFETGRGGQFTYHGPGQRIAYVMLDLNARGGDVRGLVGDLERWVIAALAAFNVTGEPRPGRVGVWIVEADARGGRQEKKIAAMGLRVSRGVTTHGVSVNIAPDLSHYDGIVPCGLAGYGVTSVAELGLPVTMAEADAALRRSFEPIFGTVRPAPPPA